MRATLKQELRAVLRDPVPGKTPAEQVKPYAVVAATVTAATAAKLAATEMGVGEHAAFLFYWAPVFVSAYFGARAGVLAALLGAILGAFFYIPPENDFQFDATSATNAVIFFVEAAAVGLFISGLRSTIRQRSEREMHLRLLSEVGHSLSGDTTAGALDHTAELTIGRFADICVIDLVQPDGSITRAALHAVPALDDELVEGMRVPPPDPSSETDPIAIVLRSGAPMFLQDLGDVSRFARTNDHQRVLRRVPAISAMTLPLQARRTRQGTISFTRLAGSRQFNDADFLFGQEFAARVAAYLERTFLLEELAVANRAKDDFLGVLSHEMRSPITVINGGVDLLLSPDSQLDEGQHVAMIRTVRAEAERLGTLFDNLLTLATGTDNTPLEMEPLNVARFLREFVPVLGERLGESRVHLVVGERLPIVEVVQTYVEQILRNLLTNAQKYSPAGSPILVEALCGGDGWLEMSVMDRGPGVPEEELERIFTPYYRTPDGKRKAAGFGVGLGVARQLAELMQGTLRAELPAEGGLKVILRLPPVEMPEE